MFKYYIDVHFGFDEKSERIGVKSNVMAWEIFTMLADRYHEHAIIKIIDGRDGNVLESNSRDYYRPNK